MHAHSRTQESGRTVSCCRLWLTNDAACGSRRFTRTPSGIFQLHEPTNCLSQTPKRCDKWSPDLDDHDAARSVPSHSHQSELKTIVPARCGHRQHYIPADFWQWLQPVCIIWSLPIHQCPSCNVQFSGLLAPEHIAAIRPCKGKGDAASLHFWQQQQCFWKQTLCGCPNQSRWVFSACPYTSAP